MLWIGGAIVAVALAAIFAADFLYQRGKNVDKAQDWAISGPPCPQTTRAAFEAQGFRTPKTTEYDGILFGRQAGNVQCDEIASKGGTGFGTYQSCQFTTPAVVSVTVKGKETAFLPGPGNKATVVVQGDKVSCVVAGKFGLGD